MQIGACDNNKQKKQANKEGWRLALHLWRNELKKTLETVAEMRGGFGLGVPGKNRPASPAPTL